MLRIYQHDLITQIEASVNRRILGILPTGGGKTICMSEIFNRNANLRGVAIAHRQELITQIRAQCDPEVEIYSVDKLLRNPQLINNAQLIQVDEAHHVLDNNKWGNVLHNRAKIIGWTATPVRTDKRALPWDEWIEGPTTDELVTAGYLVPIDVYSLPGFDRESIARGSSGEFSHKALVKATKLVGNVVDHYLRLAAGKRGVTFCVDVAAARDQVAAFRQKGVPAALLEAGSRDRERREAIAAFRRGDLKQLCNVDILGEGFDVPGIDVVSMARATESLGLCWQQIGRCRRTAPGKSHGLIIDHVGNVLRHGLPDGVTGWDQNKRAPVRGGSAGEMPVRQCLAHGCWRIFQSWSPMCPYCGWRPEAATSNDIKSIEGDLTLYDTAALIELQRRADGAIKGPPLRPPRTPRERVIWRNMETKRAAQLRLRAALDLWAVNKGGTSSPIYREFYIRFGIDMLSARSLSGPDADCLRERILNVNAIDRGTIRRDAVA